MMGRQSTNYFSKLASHDILAVSRPVATLPFPWGPGTINYWQLGRLGSVLKSSPLQSFKARLGCPSRCLPCVAKFLKFVSHHSPDPFAANKLMRTVLLTRLFRLENEQHTHHFFAVFVTTYYQNSDLINFIP